jgi:hypothetical protein
MTIHSLSSPEFMRVATTTYSGVLLLLTTNVYRLWKFLRPPKAFETTTKKTMVMVIGST